jgi:hypothetical protein
VATAAYHGDRPSFPPSPRAWSVIAGAADGPIGCALTFLFVTTRRGHERANQNRPALVPVKPTITREIQWFEPSRMLRRRLPLARPRLAAEEQRLARDRGDDRELERLGD